MCSLLYKKVEVWCECTAWVMNNKKEYFT
jgi:hypothetical protein